MDLSVKVIHPAPKAIKVFSKLKICKIWQICQMNCDLTSVLGCQTQNLSVGNFLTVGQ